MNNDMNEDMFIIIIKYQTFISAPKINAVLGYPEKDISNFVVPVACGIIRRRP